VRGRAIAKDTVVLDDGRVLRGRQDLGRRVIAHGGKVLAPGWGTARNGRQCRGCGKPTYVRDPDGRPVHGEACAAEMRRIETETAIYVAEHYPNIEEDQ